MFDIKTDLTTHTILLAIVLSIYLAGVSCNAPAAKTNLSAESLNKYFSERDRELEHIKDSNKLLKGGICGCLIIITVMGIFIVSRHYRDKGKPPSGANERESMPSTADTTTTTDNNDNNDNNDNTLSELRNQLRNKVYTLHEQNGGKSLISPQLLHSEAYQQLQNYLAKGMELKENDNLWTNLEEAIHKSSPNFEKTLRLLVGGKLNSYDLHTSILIKCGVTPTQMTILLNRSKGAIVSRRESLCIRIFDKKLGTKVIDNIIRLL